MLAWSVSAQKYHKCSIYEFRDSAHHGLICTQIFNEQGKIIHEAASYYCYYDVNGGQTYIKDDGVYDYYYEDTILIRSEYSDMHHRGLEHPRLTKTFFLYNNLKKVVKEIIINRVYDSPADTSISLEDDSRYINPARHYADTLDTLEGRYEYDVLGRLFRRDSFEYYKYDKENRLILDSISGNPAWIKKYKYSTNGYVVYHWHGRYPPDSKDEYILDEKSRVMSISHFYYNDFIKNDSYNAYTLFCRDVTEYYPDGRIAKHLYYTKDGYGDLQLTTTHVFVYE